MGGIRWRDSSTDSGYATDKTVEDGMHLVGSKNESEICANWDSEGCSGTRKELQRLGLDLKPVRGKGLGLVALRDFEKGEVVLSERALVKVGITSAYSSWTRQQAVSVLRQVYKMSGEERAGLFKLSARQNSKQPLVLRIVSNNCFNIDLRTFGVFLNISRINHSCVPNCIDSAGSDESEKRVLTLRRILCGEELSLSYLHAPEGSKAMRAAELKYWNFVCTCELCLCEGRGESMLRENIVKVVGDMSGFVGQLEKARDEEPHMDDDQKRLLSASIYCEIGKQLDACENLLCRVTQLSHPPPQLKKSSHLHAARLIVKKHSMGLAGHSSLKCESAWQSGSLRWNWMQN